MLTRMARLLARMAHLLTRMGRLLTRMARLLTRMTRWLTVSHIIHTQKVTALCSEYSMLTIRY